MSAAQALSLSSRVHNGRASLLSARRTRTARPMHAGAAQAASGKLTLYTNPRSRSQIVEWYAKELGISYEVQMLDMGAGAHKAPAYLKVHPFGQLPAITCEDGTAVFESGAVILYLADKFDKASQTPEARAAAASWVLWSNSSFAPAVFGPSRAAKLPGLLAPLEAKLKASPFMLGTQFTVADIAVGAYLAYTKIFFGEEFKAYPAVKEYLDEIEKRPAFHATIGSE